MPERLNLPIDYIIEQYQSGRSCRDIAREFGIKGKVISKRLKENDVPIRSNIFY